MAQPRPRARANGKQHDPAACQIGFVEGERVDRPGRQRQLVEREAAKRAADVLLAVAAHQLGDLRAEPGVDLGVALGFVGQEVDGGELDRLQERAGLTAAATCRSGPVRSRADGRANPGAEAVAYPGRGLGSRSARAARPHRDRS